MHFGQLQFAGARIHTDAQVLQLKREEQGARSRSSELRRRVVRFDLIKRSLYRRRCAIARSSSSASVF